MGLGRCGCKCGVPFLVYTLPSLIGQAPLECILLSKCSWLIWLGIILRESFRSRIIDMSHDHHHCLLINRWYVFISRYGKRISYGRYIFGFFWGGGILTP
jgi:hypothetical protein